MDFWRAVEQQLQDWQKAGLTHLPQIPVSEVPVQEPPAALKNARPLNAPASQSMVTPATSVPVSRHPTATPTPHASESASLARKSSQVIVPKHPLDSQQRQIALDSVASVAAKCTRCPHLAVTRNKVVFGTGNPEARIMFIGEAPGADEDETGIPFVGKAGQLLDKIIAACGWKREDLYICNILRCRPPGNRTPLPEEAANCREYLDAQISIVKPEYIICWGASAAHNLLTSKVPIGQMRKQFFEYGSAKVTCTYHPSYLLRNPAMKKEVWEDMKFFLRELGVDPDQLAGNQ
jgi:DNA polymerase